MYAQWLSFLHLNILFTLERLFWIGVLLKSCRLLQKLRNFFLLSLTMRLLVVLFLLIILWSLFFFWGWRIFLRIAFEFILLIRLLVLFEKRLLFLSLRKMRFLLLLELKLLIVLKVLSWLLPILLSVAFRMLKLLIWQGQLLFVKHLIFYGCFPAFRFKLIILLSWLIILILSVSTL